MHFADEALLDPIEKAIRNALEKGDADDPEFRERVYQAVRGALDRAIQANPQLTVERVIARRKSLEEKIAEIETEFRPALPPEPEPEPEPPAKIEERLDEALLDVLSQSPLARQPNDAGKLPEWPTLERTMQTPAAVQPAPSISVAAPPPAKQPVRQEPRIEPARQEPSMRGEAFVRPTLSGNGLQPRVQPEMPTAPRQPVPVEPPLAAPSRFEPTESPRASVPGAAAPAGSAAEAPRNFAVDTAPLIDLGVLPEVPRQGEPDADFPANLPPGLDAPDISAPVPPASPEVAAADRRARSRERRRPFAAAFFGIAILSLAAVGLLFAFQTGMLKSPAERDTSVHNPPAELPAEDFTPTADGSPPLTDQVIAAEDWVSLFSPDKPDSATAPGDAAIEPMQDDSGAFVRIRSGASGSAIIFDVPQSLLEKLAARHAVFSVTARAEGGKESEISIECNFGELGDCGRRRYLIGYEKAEYLFELDVPNKRPGANGRIAINSDFSGQGKAIDVYEIRVAVQ